MSTLSCIRKTLRASTFGDEAVVIKYLLDNLDIDADLRQSTVEMASSWVREMRASGDPGLMESFLAEYGLSTQEGVALMCMAEAYLRVPDNKTLDELIEDKIAPQNFGDHLGHSSSLMVNASTWGLMLTGSVLSDSDQRGLLPSLQKVVKRAGEPIIRAAVKRMMKMMGGQFVLGEDINAAIDNGKSFTKKGYRYSFDMLGEAAHTLQDADRYYLAYADAITELVAHCKGKDVRTNPGISVKLSALYPRYETLHKNDVMKSLYPSLMSLCLLAKKTGIGLNIDAEEAERLDISLDIIKALLKDGSLEGWDGLGIVVQAYSYRAPHVLDWLYALANKYDARLMVRLVKGAYWDREIKRSQELGLSGYPVYTRKNNSDLSYWYCAKKLLAQRDKIFPQFATHNAHTVASILRLTEGEENASSTFEFQRLHGMGEALHELVRKKHDISCRIYAPVGVHQDLLAYLVRRLLENGANASFVSQVLDNQIPPSEVTADPFNKAEVWLSQAVPGVAKPDDLFLPERDNSKGFDWLDVADIEKMESLRAPFKSTQWTATPLISGGTIASAANNNKNEVHNPATGEVVGWVTDATAKQLDAAIEGAHKGQADWQQLNISERGRILNKAADLYEQNAGELFALLAREAGKTIVDCIGELREAVDFLRYYGAQAEHIAPNKQACGVMACISPWNFPLAIFSGQLSAALAVGNAVLVKPAESTSLIAFKAVQLFHEAGVPEAILQFLPGQGSVIGAGLSGHPMINGMIFTGSTATAKLIERSMSQSGDINAPFIAETGGLNAMIVDSSALAEQAVTDIVASAFQSAGQRCSALRVLYLQEDIAEHTLEMLYGSMDLLKLGNPWDFSTDVGPVIDAVAAKGINDYIAENQSAITKQTPLKNISKEVQSTGFFIPPTVIKIDGIQGLSREIFGPVLHVATYKANKIGEVLTAINNAGFGLTFGLHTRIDSRVQNIVDGLKVGNMYVNRNQIGAIVGSQPFGGEGLSGTGPKAGGPYYLQRLVKNIESLNTATKGVESNEVMDDVFLDNCVKTLLASATEEFGQLFPLDPEMSKEHVGLINHCRHDLPETRQLPGPTGEDNLLSLNPRGLTLIATPDVDIAFQQAIQALFCGNPLLVCNAQFDETQKNWLLQHPNVVLSDKAISAAQLTRMPGLVSFVYTVSNDDQLDKTREFRVALANRVDAIVRFINEAVSPYLYAQERHLCINTTAAGGNVQLIANSE